MALGKVARLAVIGCLGVGTPLHAAPPEQDPVVASSEQASLEDRAAQIVALLNGELAAAPETVFTPEMLAAVPAAQITALAAQFNADYGRASQVESLDPQQGTNTDFVIRMERALAKGKLVLDPEQGNRITGLRFTGFEPIVVSVDEVLADIAALPGTVSAYFGPLDGDPVLSVNQDSQLALGSAFKLYVLAALSEEIVKGKRSWRDIVPLETRSFPSGLMQDWPEGAPVTLQTLASLMISISDNTATDQLIALLGRDRIARMVADSGHSNPQLNRPFLTTRELFELKGGDPDRLALYARGDADLRGQILDGLTDNGEVTLDQVNSAFSQGPVALDVEWFASPRDFARLFRHMETFADDTTYQVMAISPNLPESAKANWSYAGFKGGSEPGVLNLTWLLTDPTGESYLLTLGWNNPQAEVDLKQLERIAERILALPR